MKQLFTTCLFFIAIHFASAQTVIQNGGLENWENLGSATEEPLNWNSNKTGDNNASSSFAPQTCFRDVNPHSGTYCAKIVTGTAQIVGTVVNGSLTTGQIDAPTTNKQDVGYIFTDSTRAGNTCISPVVRIALSAGINLVRKGRCCIGQCLFA